ncbi:type II toxin-antitoxin system death-on-curing family toxin [Saccharothrix syringae]|uniref:Type II toxin-antitoxin system death-on-curing family toxin n=1 Tax=Saccharothrix syringae TaxID=103733 RepID=A0A5Q0GRP0_SACSY|nr:type II toxin-antitoxin system death-on-curing family toxin [Saccharothrix syringae]QFZ16727.1 type II toxin-antitoxin system death-on-curing family toxin [Saccharothrix syringae]
MSTVDYLTPDDLLTLAADLGVPQVRDPGLLDAAAHRPRSSLMGEDAYPDLREKAAVLMQSVLRNHPLVDGNKRLGWMSAFVFLGLNGLDLDAPEDDAYDLVIELATSAVDHSHAAARLAEWTRGK